MFDIAARKKLRFETAKGLLTVEDLWDLPLTSATGKTNLDAIALDLHRELKSAADVVSFVDDTTKADSIVQLRFDIVKHIIDVRKQENLEVARKRERAETKQRLLTALERKQGEAIDALSEEELRKRIAEL